DQSTLRETARQAGVLDAVIFLGKVDNSTLHQWYKAAEVFVMPSLSEGFGFPALEALYCGTLVAAARATCLPEVLGDAALFFDPLDVEDIAQTIWRLLEDRSLGPAMRRRGYQRV